MKKLTLNSYAKLNLHLELLNKRKDNYHNLRTIFERIDLADTIVLKPRPDSLIVVSCSDPKIPCDESNLCYRSAKLLQDNYCVPSGVNIKIIKRIPTGAGLGGGSSNAATALLGLNKLWNLRLTCKELVYLAGKIGSDVPFFVYDTPFALGEARGDRITPLSSLKKLKLWHVLVAPDIFVSTPLIFREWDKRFLGKKQPVKRLTDIATSVKIWTLARSKRSVFYQDNPLRNDLEQVTISLYPEVELIKQKLAFCGAGAVLMSGSGPAVFGICSAQKGALVLAKKLSSYRKSWRVFAVKTH